MLDRDQLVEVTLNTNNIKWYSNRGYDCSANKITVKAEDLLLTSHIRVMVHCDICDEQLNIEYGQYVVNINKNNQYICPKCARKLFNAKRHSSTLNERRDNYYEKLLNISQETGYEIITTKEEITNNYTRIKYICPKHGEHEMRLANLINGRRCPQCANEHSRELYKLSTDEVIKRVSDCGAEILNPEEYINQSTYNLIFRCIECGDIFISSLQRFTQHGGQLCEKCRDNESVGVKKIKMVLETLGISYVQEKWFLDCRDIKPLPFDFYLPDYNTIIEFDGRQHFEETNYFSHSIGATQKHDCIKNEYCKKNQINLIRIPYTQINHIEDIINNELFA